METNGQYWANAEQIPVFPQGQCEIDDADLNDVLGFPSYDQYLPRSVIDPPLSAQHRLAVGSEQASQGQIDVPGDFPDRPSSQSSIDYFLFGDQNIIDWEAGHVYDYHGQPSSFETDCTEASNVTLPGQLNQTTPQDTISLGSSDEPTQTDSQRSIISIPEGEANVVQDLTRPTASQSTARETAPAPSSQKKPTARAGGKNDPKASASASDRFRVHKPRGKRSKFPGIVHKKLPFDGQLGLRKFKPGERYEHRPGCPCCSDKPTALPRIKPAAAAAPAPAVPKESASWTQQKPAVDCPPVDELTQLQQTAGSWALLPSVPTPLDPRVQGTQLPIHSGSELLQPQAVAPSFAGGVQWPYADGGAVITAATPAPDVFPLFDADLAVDPESLISLWESEVGGAPGAQFGFDGNDTPWPV